MPIYNFSAGPAAIPEPVLRIVQEELLNYRDSGMSVMELSHRGDLFGAILNEAVALFKELMQIPENYKVLFVPGGASMQFAMMPMNLTVNKKSAFIDTGVWSSKAIKEAQKYMEVQVLASSKDSNYSMIPDYDLDLLSGDEDYVHITTNNTIYGTRFHQIPELDKVPLIADMSSDILSKPYDLSKFAMIYAGAQKNLGPSGFAVVIIREDLLERSKEQEIPSLLNYKILAENNSMFNTPPTFGIYICKLVLEWIKEQGGAAAMEKINNAKADLLYDYLDHSDFYKATVAAPFRSIMNIPFVSPSAELDALFVQEAQQAGLKQLKGHRTVGGMRASIYNAMPIEGVEALVSFMKNFEAKNG